MQSKSRPLDDISNLLTNAVGAVKGVGDEVKAVARAQAEKIIAEMDLVSRDEFEVLKARLDSLQTENEAIKAEIAALKPKPRKSRAKKAT
ncbi:MAG: accessory factor UbiK family protein [Maricaulaceae bacterium]